MMYVVYVCQMFVFKCFLTVFILVCEGGFL